MIRLWLQRFNVRPEAERGFLLVGGLVAIAAWPIYFAALVRVLRSQPLVFKVTPKGRGAQGARCRRGDCSAPHLLWAADSALACLVVHAVSTATPPC